jgi:predicted phosphodiesterase
MRRLLWAVWWTGFAVLIAVVSATLWAAFNQPVHARFGNTARPETSPAVSRIAVFGDTQKGLAAFAELAARAKREGIDLAIHTGDLVSRADVGHYDLATRWVQRANLGVPFVVTPGNHDIKSGNGLFEQRIGPRQFAFRWGPVDIVVIDNAVGPPDLGAVQSMLAAARGPILLFMHVPPLDGEAIKPGYTKFVADLAEFPVRYVFSGHVHGYSRVRKWGIVFISNGVGGDSESWQFDQKAHLTIVEANGSSITDQSIVVEPVLGIGANLEHLAIGHVGEIVLRRTWGIPALLFLILALFLAYRSLRKKRQTRTAEDKPTLRFTPAKTSDPPDIVI